MLDVQLASPQRHDALTIFPLVTSQIASLDYQLLGDSGATLRVDEVGEGVVPVLSAVNDGDVDVLLVDGEQLIGAKQNRMVNRSIVVPARSRVEIPVSCIEQGRWHMRQRGFSGAPQHSPASVRRSARDVESRRVRAGVAADAASLHEAQAEVWGAVAKLSGDIGVRSPTGALNDAYDSRRDDIDEIASAFEHVDGQIGLLAFAGAEPLGLDIIGGRRLYARLHGRMLRGWLMEALARRAFGAPADVMRAADGVTPRAAQEFLDRSRGARRTRTPTVGRGEWRVLDGSVIGGELIDRHRIVHMAVFPA